MKHLLIIGILLSTLTSFGQQKKETAKATFQVAGICKMCKGRIEEAANYTKGVKSAEWDKASEILTVEYRSDKTSPQKIGNAIAKAGHDNQYAKASDKDYDRISNCCKYKTQPKH